MKKYQIYLFVILLTLGIIATPNFALSVDTEEIAALNKEITARKDKIKQLEESIAQYNKNITQKQLESVSLKNQLGILDNRTAKLGVEIDLTREKIKETELQIQSLQLTIGEKETSIAKQKKIITTLIQHLNAEGEKKYIEILLTNDSFADFFDQVKYLENIYIDLGSSVKALRLAKMDLDNKKKEVENRKSNYLTFKEELEDKNEDLKDQVGVKQALLTQTKSSELRYKILLEAQRKQYQAIEGELRVYEDKVRKKLEEQNKISESTDVAFAWPTISRYITATFHDPGYPFRKVFEHSGLDIRSSQGQPIKASASGYVARAVRCTSASCYSYILLVHSGNISTVYGHLSKIVIANDQFVNKGDIIGYSGGTPGTAGAGPFVTGPHLHFETRLNGIPVNPLGYLSQ